MIVLSVGLMVADHHFHRLDQIRYYGSLVVYPIQRLMDGAVRSVFAFQGYVLSHHQLIQQNVHLRNEQLSQNARLQKLMSLEAENARLRTLLQSSPRGQESFLVAEIIQIDSDPFSHRILLDKGKTQGVYLGQPIIDAEGIIGEVVEVYPMTSRAILLTDASHGIPVENVRNGLRGIAVGTGTIKTLELQHIPNTVDLRIGDTLVTSGLGGRYPVGYPVGIITQIDHDPGEAFALVRVTPCAHLERTRQVLLIERKEGS